VENPAAQNPREFSIANFRFPNKKTGKARD